MKRALFAIFGTITGLVVLLGFKTHNPTPAGLPAAVSTSGPDSTSGDGSAGGSGTTGPGSGPPTTPAATSSPAKSSGGTKTVTGASAETQFGPVQVQITVQNGQLVGVRAVVYPTRDPRDREINSYAIPQLNSEALAAKSAKIDMVSGATYTSDGYLQSLQSALDKAGL